MMNEREYIDLLATHLKWALDAMAARNPVWTEGERYQAARNALDEAGTIAPKDPEWIQWGRGCECPVPADASNCEVVFSDGVVLMSTTFEEFVWQNVVAYRFWPAEGLTKPTKPEHLTTQYTTIEPAWSWPGL
jgi:hypothetical protein